MDLKIIRESLSKVKLLPETEKMVEEILTGAEAKGDLTEEEKDKILELISLEAEADEMQADALQQVVLALDDYIKETDKIVDEAEEELKKIEEEMAIQDNK